MLVAPLCKKMDGSKFTQPDLRILTSIVSSDDPLRFDDIFVVTPPIDNCQIHLKQQKLHCYFSKKANFIVIFLLKLYNKSWYQHQILQHDKKWKQMVDKV
jgi:hypothetical protein